MIAMVLLPVSASWTPLGSEYYRKHDLYSMKWRGVIPTGYQSSISCFGGPIALADDSGGFQKSFNIYIYSASGQNICKIPWNNGELVRMGWSSCEELVCVRRDGRVFLYSMFGVPLSVSGQPSLEQGVFTMGNEAQELKVVSCQIFHNPAGSSTGIAVLTRAYRFYLVTDIRDPKVWRTMELVNSSGSVSVPKPTCWTVVCVSGTSKCFIYAAVETGELFKYSRDNQPEQIHPVFDIPVKEFRGMVASPDASKIALMSENGFVQIAPLDFKTVFCEVDSGMRSKPTLFSWCGSSAIACCESPDAETVTLFSLHGDSAVFTLTGSSAFGVEPDGIHVVSSETHEFLAPVPESLAGIFRMGSMSPGSLLHDAYKEFEQSSSKASEYIQILENSTGGSDSGIEAAVQQCVDGAGHAALEPADQTVLLKAAAFGKNFRPEMESSHLVNMCRILRILNILRAPHLAIPLTFAQLDP